MNTFDKLSKDLSNYSDKDLSSIAKYMNINTNNNRKILKLKIATIQFNKYYNSNLNINVPDRGSVTISEDCLQGYEIEKLLGSGTYGAVHLAKKLYDINPKKKYAVKFQNLYIDKSYYKNPIQYEKDKKKMENEFIEESNIASLFLKNSIGPKLYQVWICSDIEIGVTVTELWDSALKKEELCNLSPLLVKKIRDQILKIHDLGYIHYDIKPDNILVKKDWTGKIIDITLADFGLAAKSTIKQDSLVFYNYHKQYAPDFYKKITLEMTKINPYLFDYGLLYQMEKCNPNVVLGPYPVNL